MRRSGDVSYEESVVQTNHFASYCKRMCVVKNYWHDPYIHYFVVDNAHFGYKPFNCTKKSTNYSPPEILRGYAIRVIHMFDYICSFIDKYQNDCQIVNLGAGFDTLLWKLNDKYTTIKRSDWNVILYEIDFNSVVSWKSQKIQQYKQLNQILVDSSYSQSTNEISSKLYHLIKCDIRNIDDMWNILFIHGFSKIKPTLFIAECVLSYLEDNEINNLISSINYTCTKAYFLEYDPILTDDKFIYIMKNNLVMNDVNFRGDGCCASLNHHNAKFINNGWNKCESITLYDIYHNDEFMDTRKRIDAIEMIDEPYLLSDLLTHYCIVKATNF